MLQEIVKEVRQYQEKYGADICSDVTVENGIASYRFMPDDPTGYIMQINLETGERRNCGFGRGCFWTEWR